MSRTPRRASHQPSAREPSAALGLLRRHGLEATSFQTLGPRLSHWFSEDREAMVAYVATGGSWVAAGSAVCAPERLAGALQAFADAARAHGRRAVLFAVEDRTIDVLLRPAPDARHRFTWVKIGEQPVFDPRIWSLEGPVFHSVRAQVRRAANHGVRVREVPHEAFRPGSPLRDAAEDLIADWRDHRHMSPMGFLVDLEPFLEAPERRYFVAERGGELVGMLAAVPVYARGGWFAEDLIRRPSAPNGTAEALIHAAMTAWGAEGAGYATLGLAALAGIPAPPERRAPSGMRWWLLFLFIFAWRHLNFLYSFRGIRAFKQKFRPQRWEAVYMAVTPPSISPFVVFDMLSAFVPGSRVVFLFDTLSRVGRALAGQVPVSWLRGVAWAFSLLLIPWIGLLLSVDADARFGAAWLAWAWASFDLAMGLAFALLAVAMARWGRLAWSLSRVMLGAVLADVWLTGAQVVLFNLPRARHWYDTAVAIVAVAAPVSAALFLTVVVLALRPRASKHPAQRR